MTDLRGLVRPRPAALDPGTSMEAASKQKRVRIDLVKVTILALLAKHGARTDEEIEGLYGDYIQEHPQFPMASPQSLRTRRHELVIAGKVRDSGTKGTTKYGNPSVKWEVRS